MSIVKIGDCVTFIKSLLPIRLRKSKSFCSIEEAMVLGVFMEDDASLGQSAYSTAESVMAEARLIGQVGVVMEEVKRRFRVTDWYASGTNGNVVLVGQNMPNVVFIGGDNRFLVYPMSMTDLGCDFIVRVSSGMSDKAVNKLRLFLQKFVLKGIEFKIKKGE